jgi:hypothetical protein
MNQPNTPFTLTPFAPHPAAPTLAIQFRGELDPDSTSHGALHLAQSSAPSRSPDLTLVGTFVGFPVRLEPYRHVPQATIPAPVHATLHFAPDTVPAVLVPTPSGGQPAFPGDWIVQASDGTFSVWSDEKFRAGFDVPEASGSGTLRYEDGSGTGRYGAHDNWTFGSDGTEYPGSYGVAGPASGDTFTVGTRFRILREDKTVDPVVHVATNVQNGLVSYYESAGKIAEVNRDHVVASMG